MPSIADSPDHLARYVARLAVIHFRVPLCSTSESVSTPFAAATHSGGSTNKTYCGHFVFQINKNIIPTNSQMK